MHAKLLQLIDSGTDELESSFWALLTTIADEAQTPPLDVLHYFKRTAIERLRSLKAAHGVDRVDDGRAALWRIRILLWHTTAGADRASLVADSDPEQTYDANNVAPGSSVIAGLPAVAREVKALVEAYHAGADPGWIPEGISEPTLQSKLRGLRVSLSNSGGQCVWRVRYTLTPPAGSVEHTPGSLRGVRSGATQTRHYMAEVRVAREAPAPRHIGGSR